MSDLVDCLRWLQKQAVGVHALKFEGEALISLYQVTKDAAAVIGRVEALADEWRQGQFYRQLRVALGDEK